jgi:hypothetical protein
MDHPNRGVALIFTFDRLNYCFEKKCNLGMVFDADRLSKTFSECLQFDVHRYSSLIKSDFEEMINAYTKRDYTNDDCFVFAIRGHGSKKDEVQCADGEYYDTKKLADIFMEVPSLKGKPKIFLFGMCRGDLFSVGPMNSPQVATVQSSSAITIPHQIESSESDTNHSGDEPLERQTRETDGNVFRFYSIISGYVSVVSSLSGSLPFQKFCDELENRDLNLIDLDMIFLSVKNYVSNQKLWYGIKVDNVEIDIPIKIFCENVDSATKKLFFSKKDKI